MSRPVTRRDFLQTLGLSAAALAASCAGLNWKGGTAPATKPNIIFFLVDDMGWMDTTVNGSRYYETPNMERLAKMSMVFSDAHTASPLCSPTRASLMTGQYPARTRVTTAGGHRPPVPDSAPWHMPNPGWRKNAATLLPRPRFFIKPEEYTIAEALRNAGYCTAHIGKWHLGLDPEYWPERQGFEFSFHGAPDPGPRSYFSPYKFPAGTVTDGPKGEYITDRLTDEAIKFMKEHKNEPFFLNLWHYGVHGPWGHKEEYTKYFANKKDPRGKQGNPIMASMLKSVDESLGRVLDELDSLGIAGNTIVIFFSDNGGNSNSNTLEDKTWQSIGPEHPAWARKQDWLKYADNQPPTNNFPLRMGKATIYEGGTRVPMMVRWPGVVQPGSKNSGVVSSVDFYPTLLEMAGIKKQVQKPLDGTSILPLLNQSGQMKREAIFVWYPHDTMQTPPGASVRKGDWKLIRWYETSSKYPEKYELYNLKDDLSETKNLAAQMPDRVRELDALINKHLADTHAVVPVPASDTSDVYRPRRPDSGAATAE